MINRLLDKTYKYEALSVFAEDPPPPATMQLRRTGPRICYGAIHTLIVLVSRYWRCFQLRISVKSEVENQRTEEILVCRLEPGDRKMIESEPIAELESQMGADIC